jgi:aspartyl aminopeptidase
LCLFQNSFRESSAFFYLSGLLAANFTEVSEADVWDLQLGGRYFFTRNTTTIVAFTIGGAYEAGNGFTVVGAHTDSPCLRIKPVTTTTKSDALVLNTQPYGGGLWHTWFDRDLGLAGRVIVRTEAGTLENRLVRIDSPIARIPNLAIHLTSGTERESFAPNLHEHAKPILTMDPAQVKLTFESGAGVDPAVAARLNPFVLGLVAKQLGVTPASIVDMELQLIDVQPSTLGGATNEFLISGRLDNLCSSYQALRALIDNADEDLAAQKNIAMALLFDHEEVGSSSCTGAGSSLFIDTLRTINQLIADGTHGNSLLSAIHTE